jgi:hypothetical protein
MSGSDQYVPSTTNKLDLLNKWRKACDQNVLFTSEVLEGATHAVEDGLKQDEMMIMVKRFLGGLQSKL